MSATPVKTPLVEMLRSIPADACDNYDVSPFMSHHVPYGRHLHDAADEIEALERDRDEWKAKAEANERDAEQYRWIRSHAYECVFPHGHTVDGSRTGWITKIYPGPNFDAAVNAARSAEKEKE